MRQVRFLMVIVMMILSVSVMAQKPFAGNITFEMSAEGCSDPNVAAELAEQSLEYTVMGSNYRMEMSQGIDVVTIANGTNKTYTVILGIPGYGKYYIQQNEEDVNKIFGTEVASEINTVVHLEQKPDVIQMKVLKAHNTEVQNINLKLDSKTLLLSDK